MFFHLSSLFPPIKPFLCTPALSGDCPTQRLSKYLPTLPTTHNIAVFVGAMARGRDDFADAYVDEKISISEYSLSASVACGKVFFLFSPVLYLGSYWSSIFYFPLQFCCALEELWDIVWWQTPSPPLLPCSILFSWYFGFSFDLVFFIIIPKWAFFFNKKSQS